MRTLPRAGAGLLALTLALGITACGSDDDDSTDTTVAAKGDGAASGDTGAFCDALVEFNGAVMEVEIDDTTPEADVKEAGGQLAELTQALVDNAPEDLADGAEEIHGFVTPMAEEGDASVFNQDSSFEAYGKFLGDATEACDFQTVDVTAKDYAFEAPNTVKAGNVSFALTNSSDAEEHEMIVMAKADGVDLTWEELLALPEEEAQSKVHFAGFAFAPPGESSSTLATLAPGDYAMVCFIPVGGAEDGPPHFTQGMVHEFTVE
ncbi:MAG TPA: hypothetical protein VFV32_01855 [Acidimicrobiales bacterium]|jgi:hypothetical protein|nr:hypothetical protein [Acidimicrobiales bacterium]